MHLVNSEVSHMFVKNKAKSCANVPKRAPQKFNVYVEKEQFKSKTLQIICNVVVVHMIKLQDHFLLIRRTEPIGVKQDLHSLQASGKSDNVHL